MVSLYDLSDSKLKDSLLKTRRVVGELKGDRISSRREVGERFQTDVRSDKVYKRAYGDHYASGCGTRGERRKNSRSASQ